MKNTDYLKPKVAELAALVVGLVLFVNLPRSTAQPTAVPYEIQAAIFAKIFHYDKTISKPSGKFKVVIVSSDKYREQAKSLSRSFNRFKVETTFADTGDLYNKISNASAVYIFGSEHAKAIEQFCYRQKVLSISGVPRLVKGGQVTVAIGLKDNNPQIMVNLNRAKKEGHRFSAQLLKLVKIIQ